VTFGRRPAGPTSLRGRDEELAFALNILRRTLATGRGTVLLMIGEPGMGKSAVLDEVRRQSLRLNYGSGASRAEETGPLSPGAPLLLTLRSGADPLLSREDFAELADLVTDPLLLVDRIGTHLERRAATGGVLIAIDDVHWIDRLSRFALRTLASRLAAAPVVWAFTSRDDADHLVADLSVPGLPSVPVQTVHLKPLAMTDVIAMAEDRLGAQPTPATQRLLGSVGGSPGLARQILDNLTQGCGSDRGGPPLPFVTEVRRALYTQQPLTQELIQVASVLGRPFTPHEATGLMGSRPARIVADLLHEAVASGLMIDSGRTLAFRHDLVRECVYADLSEPGRRDLHRRCATFLLRAGESPLAAAPHARAMALPGDEEAVAILRRAADQAIGPRPNTAGDLILAAFRLTPTEHPAWLEIGEQSVSILGRVQRGSDAVEVADRLLSAGFPDPDTGARIQVLAAEAQWLMSRPAEAMARVDRARSRPGVSSPLRARLQAARALTLSRSDPSSARACAEEALSAARATGDQAGLLMALRAAGEAAKNSGLHHESRRYFGDLRQRAELPYLAEEIMALQLLDRFPDADVLLKAAWRDADHQADNLLPSLIEAQLWQDLNLGRLDAAEAIGATLHNRDRQLGDEAHEVTSVLLVALATFWRGDARRAGQLIRPLLAGQPGGSGLHPPGLAILAGTLEAAEGHLAEAIRIMAPLLNSALESRTFGPCRPDWIQTLVPIGLAAGDRLFVDQAVALAEEAAARNPGVASFEGVALHARGLTEAEPDRLARAAAVLSKGPRPILYARCAQDHGQRLIRGGRRAEGVAQLDRAWKVFDQVGAVAAAASVQQVLCATGVHKTKRPELVQRQETGWDALTRTQVRVAELVAAGHSNRSAATELGVSPNTVGTHLRSIFVKLEITSRVQLTNAIHAHALAR
jgi:DNA-binding CsgD family transcriptional regulator